jgi:hypothetical protein
MNTMFLRHFLPATLGLALLTGCNTLVGIAPINLTQHDWALVEATDADGHLDQALLDGNRAPIQLTFKDDRLGVSNACNHMGGDYKLKNGRLKVGHMIQTMMACEPELMARESAIKTRLQQPLRVRIDAETSRLHMLNDAGVMVFEPVQP